MQELSQIESMDGLRAALGQRRGKESCPGVRNLVSLVEAPVLGHLYRLNQESKVGSSALCVTVQC